MKADQLRWKRVDDGFDEIDDVEGEGFYYGLEEIDDVDVVKDGSSVSFVPADRGEPAQKPAKKPAKKQKQDKKPKGANAPVEEPEREPEAASSSDTEPADVEGGFGVLASEEDEKPSSFGSWPAGLNWRIYAGLKKLGFAAPTPIQEQSIAPVLEGHDIIGKASTGSGKTLAFSIPLLQRFYADPEPVHTRPEGLVISPTRELAHQIRDHLQALVPAGDKNRIVAVTGGLSIQKQVRQLGRAPAVVIATPGRLLEVLEQMPSKQQHEWQKIPSLVLDEADRLIQSGSFAELESVLKIIGISRHRQVLVYSATFNTELWTSLSATRKRKKNDSDIKRLMEQKLGLNVTARFIDADPEGQVARSVLQAVIECPNMEKDLYLYYFLLLYPGKSVVFVNSIDAVKRIAPLLKELGVQAFGVHSDMVQKQRLRAIERFRDTAKSTLIATDVAARGLDVPQVDHVVHYHLPRTGDMYVHRSGRTARAGNMGVSVVLCSPQEASGPLPNLVRLIATKPSQIDVDYDVLEKLRTRVKLAKKIADTQSITTKVGKSEVWMTEAAEELGIELDEDMLMGGDLNRGSAKQARTNEEAGSANLKAMRAELGHLLTQKLTSNRKYLTSGTRNLAHEMLSQPESAIPGQRVRSALEELAPKAKKARVAPAKVQNIDDKAVKDATDAKANAESNAKGSNAETAKANAKANAKVNAKANAKIAKADATDAKPANAKAANAKAANAKTVNAKTTNVDATEATDAKSTNAKANAKASNAKTAKVDATDAKPVNAKTNAKANAKANANNTTKAATIKAKKAKAPVKAATIKAKKAKTP